jgi:hypothetical protein
MRCCHQGARGRLTMVDVRGTTPTDRELKRPKRAGKDPEYESRDQTEPLSGCCGGKSPDTRRNAATDKFPTKSRRTWRSFFRPHSICLRRRPSSFSPSLPSPPYSFLPMFSRLTQLTRHLARPSITPVAASSSLSPPLSPLSRAAPPKMTSSAVENSRKTIHTAACLIIGDEVLGGKVHSCTSIH